MNELKREFQIYRASGISTALRLAIHFAFTAVAFSGCAFKILGNAVTPDSPPSSLSYRCSTQVFLEANTNVADTPTVTGSGLTYSISPALPAGLSLDPNTGIISGTPMVATGLTPYTVTTSNSAGSTTATVSLETAEGYLVNDLSDAAYVGPGCVSTDPGPSNCTLRAAVGAVNALTSPNVIVLPPGTINLSSATQLAATQSVSIYGDCAQRTTISENNVTDALDIDAGPSTLENLIIRDASGGPNSGIGISSAAGNLGNITLDNLTVQNFTSGGLYATDGGNGHSGTVLLSNSVIQNNSSAGTGAGYYEIGNFTTQITNTLFSGNNSNSSGGAIETESTTVISQSLFVGNTSTSCGGAIYCSVAGGTLTITNSTFYGNQSSSVGGIGMGNACNASITNSTIVNNSSTASGQGGGVGNTSCGGSGTLTLANSIVADNRDNVGLSNCTTVGLTFVSEGHNLSDDSSCNLTSAGDQPNTNPDLGPLQNNGGPTETMALLSGSPAIDAANTASCPSIDQRGYNRHLPASCDIGAYEHQP